MRFVFIIFLLMCLTVGTTGCGGVVRGCTSIVTGCVQVTGMAIVGTLRLVVSFAQVGIRAGAQGCSSIVQGSTRGCSTVFRGARSAVTGCSRAVVAPVKSVITGGSKAVQSASKSVRGAKAGKAAATASKSAKGSAAGKKILAGTAGGAILANAAKSYAAGAADSTAVVQRSMVKSYRNSSSASIRTGKTDTQHKASSAGNSAKAPKNSSRPSSSSKYNKYEKSLLEQGKETSFKDKTVVTNSRLYRHTQNTHAGRTNCLRMEMGNAPIGKDGKPVELHHLGQEDDSILVEILSSDHNAHSAELHYHNTGPSRINRPGFDSWRSSYWKSRHAKLCR